MSDYRQWSVLNVLLKTPRAAPMKTHETPRWHQLLPLKIRPHGRYITGAARLDSNVGLHPSKHLWSFSKRLYSVLQQRVQCEEIQQD